MIDAIMGAKNEIIAGIVSGIVLIWLTGGYHKLKVLIEGLIERHRQKKQNQRKAKKLNNAVSDEVFFDLCKSGKAQLVETAITNGANVNAKDKYGTTVLMEAVQRENSEVVELLLKYGANVDAKDNNGNTALRSAVSIGNYEITEMLLKCGADVNAKNNNGGTALDMARSWKRDEIKGLLHAYGAK